MRNIHQVEIVLHIDNELNPSQRSDLISKLQESDGVEDVRFAENNEHLMLINYDRDRLHSQDVLNYVREFHMSAELLGPI